MKESTFSRKTVLLVVILRRHHGGAPSLSFQENLTMLYLGIDLHSKQLTVSLRDEAGAVVLRRQVSTRPDKVRPFLEELQRRSATEGGFVAIVEVCGFHDWLLALLHEVGCRQTILIQPQNPSKKKTDRRDANALGELLWVNRQRLAAGQRIQGVRQVQMISDEELSDRRLTSARQRIGGQRTRTINAIRQILRRHNLEWQCPTKGFDTLAVRRWLHTLPLPEGDRFHMDQLLAQWRLWDQQLVQLEDRIQQRCQGNATVNILMTIIGVGYFAALALASRINNIARFPRPRSLANYWGLTPSCRNSGQTTDRLGSITKQGSKLARFLLGQILLHVLRRDGRMRAWYRRIKARRGAKIARVAVMRRLSTIMWHMVQHQKPYQYQPLAKRDDAQSAMDPNAARRHQEGIFKQLGIRRGSVTARRAVTAAANHTQ
jgi:transposase